MASRRRHRDVTTASNARGFARSVARGFTLIEVMVTMTIIAILVGAVVLNIDFRNVGTAMRDTARRTALLMELASDQAVYARQNFGIRFHPGSYEFYVLSEDESGESSWELFEDEQLKFRDPSVPTEFAVDISGVPIILEELSVELDEATDEDPIKPHVLFLSNGEMMPDFRVLITDEDREFEYVVETGEIEPVVVEQVSGS